MSKKFGLDCSPNPPKYKVGDKVWIVQRFIAIQCTIIDIDDYFAKRHPEGGIYFYWFDEPIGHGTSADDCYSKEEAKEVLLDYWQEDEDSYLIHPEDRPDPATIHQYKTETLNQWRHQGTKFISSTHQNNGERCECEFCSEMYDKISSDFPYMPPKKPGIEWFNLEMLEN